MSGFSFADEAKFGATQRFPDGTVDFFEPSDFIIDCSSVLLNDELAKGSYGIVYNGTIGDESYAVKIEEFTEGIEEQVNILVELTMLQSYPHERLVRFFGAGFLPKSTVGAKVQLLYFIFTY